MSPSGLTRGPRPAAAWVLGSRYACPRMTAWRGDEAGRVTLGLDPRAQKWRDVSMKGGSVYILASQRNGTLYIGVTSDLPGRMYEHREGLVPGFTRQYGVTHLV